MIYGCVFWAVTVVLIVNNIIYTYLPQHTKRKMIGLTIWTISIPPLFFLATMLIGLRIMSKIMKNHSILANERIFCLHIFFFCIFTAQQLERPVAVVRYRRATYEWYTADISTETKNILLYFIQNFIYFILLICDVTFIGYVLLT